MRQSVHDLQVVLTVVVLHSIAVVDGFLRPQVPPQRPFSHEPMLVLPTLQRRIRMVRLPHHPIPRMVELDRPAVVALRKWALDPRQGLAGFGAMLPARLAWLQTQFHAALWTGLDDRRFGLSRVGAVV